MNGYIIMRAEANAVGYWREGTGFVAGSDEATMYETRDEALARLEALRQEEKWFYIVRGATLVVIPD